MSNDLIIACSRSSKGWFVIRAGWNYRNTPHDYIFILKYHWSTSEQLVHNGYGLERSNCSVPEPTLKGTNLNLLLGRLGFHICITRSQPSALTDLQDISVGPVISTSLNLSQKAQSRQIGVHAYSGFRSSNIWSSCDKHRVLSSNGTWSGTHACLVLSYVISSHKAPPP